MQALMVYRPRLVYLVDCALATTISGLVARAVLRARVILDTGDATGALARSSRRGGWLVGGIVAAIERLGYAVSSTVVVRSRALAIHVRSLSTVPTVVIPDGFDPRWQRRREGAEFRKAWGLSETHLLVGVVGSANWNRRLRWCYGRDVVEAVASVQRPDVVGAVVVRGDGLPHLRSLTEARGVRERVIFTEPGDGERLWDQLGAIDVALSTQTNDLVGRVRTTGKLVQYLAAGKFILASRVGTAAEVLPNEMLVDYHGEWDEGYFARLAARIDGLPDRASTRRRGTCLSHVAAEFAYPALMRRLRPMLFEEWRRDDEIGAQGY